MPITLESDKIVRIKKFLTKMSNRPNGNTIIFYSQYGLYENNIILNNNRDTYIKGLQAVPETQSPILQ